MFIHEFKSLLLIDWFIGKAVSGLKHSNDITGIQFPVTHIGRKTIHIRRIPFTPKGGFSVVIYEIPVIFNDMHH